MIFRRTGEVVEFVHCKERSNNDVKCDVKCGVEIVCIQRANHNPSLCGPLFQSSINNNLFDLMAILTYLSDFSFPLHSWPLGGYKDLATTSQSERALHIEVLGK